jgi:hypothetical protein
MGSRLLIQTSLNWRLAGPLLLSTLWHACPCAVHMVVQVAADVKPAVERPIKAAPAVPDSEPATAAPSDPPDAKSHVTSMAKRIVETPPVCPTPNPPNHIECIYLQMLTPYAACAHTIKRLALALRWVARTWAWTRAWTAERPMARDWCCRCMSAGAEVSGATATRHACDTIHRRKQRPSQRCGVNRAMQRAFHIQLHPPRKHPHFCPRGFPKAKAEVGSSARV